MKVCLTTAIFVVALALSGCVAPMKTEFIGEKRQKKLTAPLAERLEVQTGDSLFVEGEFVEYPAYDLTGSVDSLMPGSMGIPFSFSIEQTRLTARYSRGTRDFYCASPEKVSASFPGLGSVIHKDDCVGLAIDRQSGKMEWVVDNSIYNGTTTVWDRDVGKRERRLIGEKVYHPAVDRAAGFVQVTFQGYHSKLLHFLLREVKAGRVEETEFKFDYPFGGNIYGIRGKVFRVHDVDNVRMEYEWISID